MNPSKFPPPPHNPFGMLTPGRNWRAGSADGYRFGFNGQETVDEVNGVGNSLDFGERIYDPRLSRFLSIDPLRKEYPELTPYQFASNTPIQGIDRDGLEIQKINSSMYRMRYLGSNPFLSISNLEYVVDMVQKNVPENYNPSPRRITGAYGQDETYKGAILVKSGNILPAIDDYAEPMRPGVKIYPKGKIPYTTYIPSISGAKFNAIMSAIEALRQGVEYYFITKPIYDGNNEEFEDRSAFYTATQIVDRVANGTDYFDTYNGLEFKSGQGRADLINFINDGTLPKIDFYASQEEIDKVSNYSNKIKAFGHGILRSYNLPVKEEQISNSNQ